MRKAIVTGANGFLGSWVTKALVEQGYETSALVRKNSDISELSGIDCKLIHGDILDPASLELAFAGQEFVFHLAGLVAYKKTDRPAMQRVNVDGTANVIKACHSKMVQRMIHLSSVTAVGAGFSPEEILNEDSAFNLSHLHLGYFDTKRDAELLVKKAVSEKKLDAVMLNPSTIYGAADAKKGSRSSQLKVAQGKLKAYTSGGVSVVAVEDVVSAILASVTRGRSGERYILSGENLLIKDLFATIADLAGQPAPYIGIPPWALKGLGRLGDLASLMGVSIGLSTESAWVASLYHWFDHAKAKRELGFQPRPARFALANSVDWMRQQGLLNA